MGRRVPVIRFGSPNVEMGDIYKVSHEASDKRSITVNAMVVESIFYGPPAKNPHNITWRFLQSRGATAWDRTSLEVPQTSAYGWITPTCSQGTWSRR